MDPSLASELRVLFDEDWYLERYPDVRASGTDALHHYTQFGANEGRDPNRFFDGAWYREHYPDVAPSRMDPLLHYLRIGAAQLRNPHPRFDATWYADQHPEAAANPLVFHLLFGRRRAWTTEKPLDVRDYLPTQVALPACPPGVVVDVVVPAYRGFEETRRCLASVLADPARPPGRVIVVDDASPEPELSAWLEALRAAGRILLVRHSANRGFVASVNAGMQAAADHDVALLNSDTEVPPGWLARLAGHAYGSSRTASVSPFSNNATICGYPSVDGGPPPFGLSVEAIDAACRANAGRRVEVPTTVGFCMYIRRDALNELGLFDAKAFGRGYGEENDFCRRAAASGWRHALACDTFVYHKGKVSFGADAATQEKRAQSLLAARWPDYASSVDSYLRRDPGAPFRFAATAALFRAMGRPVVLIISHGLGGGVQRHIDQLIAGVGERANFLQLSVAASGYAISAPGLDGHSPIVIPAEHLQELLTLLRSAEVARIHLHHLLGLDLDVRKLIHALGVPFDVTVHDYFAICPQVNLLPWFDAQYCNEPGPAACNACIADRPSHAARDITSWRRENAWQFLAADRVICPSEDARARLARHGLAARAVVVPHEAVARGPWPMVMPKLTKGQKLRVAVLGVLAQQKGAPAVAAVADDPMAASLDIRLIGYPEQDLPASVRRRVRATGAYKDVELPELIVKTAPHAVWFPAQWPETYSYTLTAAIEAGLPIVASAIGAFPERLAGRPLTRLVDPAAPPAVWIEAFESLRAELLKAADLPSGERPAVPDFYADRYVPSAPSVRNAGPIDLRRSGRTAVVIIPERFVTGAPTPCAHIRLLQPLDHLAEVAGLDIIVADPEEATRYRADVIVTQRHAVEGAEPAEALLRHCQRNGTALVYDLDDDLLDIPRDHPDAPMLRPRARSVERMVRNATIVWTSTPALAQRLRPVRPDARVVANGLDERLWADPPAAHRLRQGPMRVLFMGTATHDADFALVEPALHRLHEELAGRIQFDMIGVTTRHALPAWVGRISPPAGAGQSYPGFVNWIGQHPGWDVGIAPLAETPFNQAKSAIKTMDYAALGLAVLASDVGPYRAGAPAGALLVRNTVTSWVEALSRLLRHPRLRHEMAAESRNAFMAGFTLAAQEEARMSAWREVLASKPAAQSKPAARRRPAQPRTARVSAEP